MILFMPNILLKKQHSFLSPSLFLVAFLLAISIAAFSPANLTGFVVAPSSQQATPGISCSDGDGGKAYFQASLVQSFDSHSALTMQRDSCKNDRTLFEWFCSGNIAQREEVVCSNGCVAGACRKPVVNPSQTVPSLRPENMPMASEEQPRQQQARLAGRNVPSASVDTIGAGEPVSLAIPTFTVQSPPSSSQSSSSSPQQSRENDRRQQAACVRRCETAGYRCSNVCLQGNPFTSAFCVADCARTYEHCSRRC